jgi:hypothetical protein
MRCLVLLDMPADETEEPVAVAGVLALQEQYLRAGTHQHMHIEDKGHGHDSTSVAATAPS